MIFQRRKINNEVWLPIVSHVVAMGKLLILKGFRIDMETIFSDYHKFPVETGFKYLGQEKP
jgi:hypothetical protein